MIRVREYLRGQRLVHTHVLGQIENFLPNLGLKLDDHLPILNAIVLLTDVLIYLSENYPKQYLLRRRQSWPRLIKIHKNHLPPRTEPPCILPSPPIPRQPLKILLINQLHIISVFEDHAHHAVFLTFLRIRPLPLISFRPLDFNLFQAPRPFLLFKDHLFEIDFALL